MNGGSRPGGPKTPSPSDAAVHGGCNLTAAAGQDANQDKNRESSQSLDRQSGRQVVKPDYHLSSSSHSCGSAFNCSAATGMKPVLECLLAVFSSLSCAPVAPSVKQFEPEI
jgi:hypothetical protein